MFIWCFHFYFIKDRIQCDESSETEKKTSESNAITIKMCFLFNPDFISIKILTSCVNMSKVNGFSLFYTLPKKTISVHKLNSFLDFAGQIIFSISIFRFNSHQRKIQLM